MSFPLMEGFVQGATTGGKVVETAPVYLVCWDDNAGIPAHVKMYDDKDHYSREASPSNNNNKNNNDNNNNVVEVDNIREISNFNAKKQFGFEILEYHGTRRKFLCNNVLYAKKWMAALQTVMSHYRKTSNAVITEGDRVFPVRLTLNESSQQAGFVSDNRLILTNEGLILHGVEGHNNRVKAFWHYKQIRKFGAKKSMFTVESGRKTSTGPGLWHMKTQYNEMIESLVQEKINAMLDKKPVQGSEETCDDEYYDEGTSGVSVPQTVTRNTDVTKVVSTDSKVVSPPPLPPRPQHTTTDDQYYTDMRAKQLKMIGATTQLYDDEDSYLTVEPSM